MTENNDFNNTENEKRYCVRAGYWHNYTGIGRCEDENLTTNKVCDLINEQHETIQQQKEAIEHLSYDCEYIQNTIKEAYNNERTQIGKNTLKQLLEAIQ